MHDDLFFIAMIDTALDQPDRLAALRKAFERIRRMGREPRYRRGYRQFLHWMQTAACARHDLEASRASIPTREMLERPVWIELVIEHDDTRLVTLRIDPNEKPVVRGMAPGSYRFLLDTGCVLWDGTISEHGEFASRPEPGQPLRMAAATTMPGAPQDEIRLFDGALTLRLRPDGPAWLMEIESWRQEG